MAARRRTLPEAPEADTEPPTTFEEAPPNVPPGHRDGWLRCRAIRTCLVRGMPEFEGSEFMMDPNDAKRLAERGDLEIL